jgi:hypothetical protein
MRKNLAAPQGFEPRYADPESAVLPLNEGAVLIEVGRRSGGPHRFYGPERSAVNLKPYSTRIDFASR